MSRKLSVELDEDSYEAVLAEVERLVSLDPASGSEDGDRLEQLSVLLEKYERENFLK